MSDPLIRVFTTSGVEFVHIPDPWERSTVARHWNAIREFLEYGDVRTVHALEAELLRSPSGVMVGDVELTFDLDLIERKGFEGETGFESIYES